MQKVEEIIKKYQLFKINPNESRNEFRKRKRKELKKDLDDITIYDLYPSHYIIFDILNILLNYYKETESRITERWSEARSKFYTDYRIFNSGYCFIAFESLINLESYEETYILIYNKSDKTGTIFYMDKYYNNYYKARIDDPLKNKSIYYFDRDVLFTIKALLENFILHKDIRQYKFKER